MTFVEFEAQRIYLRDIVVSWGRDGRKDFRVMRDCSMLLGKGSLPIQSAWIQTLLDSVRCVNILRFAKVLMDLKRSQGLGILISERREL